MAVRFNIDANKIQVKMDNAWKNGLEMLSSQVLKDCNQYCKEDTGMLIMSSFIHSKLNEGKLKRILFCGTGALLSPTSSQQGMAIPGVCHAVSIITGRD